MCVRARTSKVPDGSAWLRSAGWRGKATLTKASPQPLPGLTLTTCSVEHARVHTRTHTHMPRDEPRQRPEGRKRGEGYREVDLRPAEASTRGQWTVPVTGEAHPRTSQLGPDGEKIPSCGSEGLVPAGSCPLPPCPLSFPTCSSCHKSSL